MMMDELMTRVQQFAAEQGITPGSVLRRAIDAGGGEWRQWVSGERSPTMERADRLLAYIDKHSKTPAQ